MGIGLVIQSIITAFSLGLGCGTCCGTSVSVYLTSYIMVHANNMKKTFLSFASFFLGKILSVVVLCTISSIIGKQLMTEDGYIFGINVNTLIRGIIIILGIVLIIKWYMEYRKKETCKECKGACGEKHKNTTISKWPTFVIGLVYGITPCAPLLMILGYSIALPVYGAIMVGISFSIATTVSPLLFLILVAGVLSKKMYEEIPKYINYVKLACYITFVCLAFVVL